MKKLPLSLRMIRNASFPRKLGILERLYGRKLSLDGIFDVVNGQLSKKMDLEISEMQDLVARPL